MPALPRMTPENSAVLVIDAQEKLLRVMPRPEAFVAAVALLLDVAGLLGVPRLATEQYPKGLGPTVPELARRLTESPIAKTAFSAAPGLRDSLDALARPNLILVGTETHICVARTALDLARAGYVVSVAVDGAGGRRALDHDTALRRLEAAGVTLTTVEAVAYEWLGDAAHLHFKAVSKLVQERPVA